MKTETIAALAVIGVVTLYVTTKAAAAAAVDFGAGIATGNNAITAGARTNAYQGAGIFGTLGAATDAVFGGLLSQAGETLGGWIYDTTH